jgi:cellulose synthase/poly-beta-1,6-N-acetylglucosamine synthase-like glycosyltransferase
MSPLVLALVLALGAWWALAAVTLGYLWFLALASARPLRLPCLGEPRHRIAVLIPAHNEAPVIANTIALVQGQDYPPDLVDTFVVADHCTDRTAAEARRAGATCFEREDTPAGSKGAALNWLLDRIRAMGLTYDAFLYLDADSEPPPNLLRCADSHLAAGRTAIQARAGVANPGGGIYPALRWAMVIADERLQQRARACLGLPVRPSGMGFCMERSLAESAPWPTDLTEDLEMRWQLLSEGIRVSFEPRAAVATHAPLTWPMASRQRARWLVGASRSSLRYRRTLLARWREKKDPALLDGLAQTVLPSYSTLAIVSVAALAIHALLTILDPPALPAAWLWLQLPLFAGLALYPFLGLALEKAPLRAYLVMLIGPAFVVWRTWIAFAVRVRAKPVSWSSVRTQGTEGERWERSSFDDV